MRYAYLTTLFVAYAASTANAYDGLDLASIFGNTPEGGIIAPSDHRFDKFISPVSNPVFFEDPRTLTEARFIFMEHRLPGSLGGGDAQVAAVQLRAALTDKLSVIATKDGYIFTDSPILNDGWGDVAAGLKYNLYADPDSQQLLSVGAVYEIPAGSSQALQGNGNGEFNIFATGGMQFLENWHYLSSSGFRLPADRSAENQIFYWNSHLDYNISGTGWYLLGETNWYHWMSSAKAFPLPVQGLDLFNLGSQGIGGSDIFTGAVGLRYKFSPNLIAGFVWEAPMTSTKGVMKDRYTFDLIWRY